MNAINVEKKKGQKGGSGDSSKQSSNADALRREFDALFDRLYVLKLGENLQKAKS